MPLHAGKVKVDSMYIDSFQFPGVGAEEQFVNYIRRTCYNSFYPFGVFAVNLLESLSFAEITILYLIQERFPTLCTIA